LPAPAVRWAFHRDDVRAVDALGEDRDLLRSRDHVELEHAVVAVLAMNSADSSALKASPLAPKGGKPGVASSAS
jgi:hypothetical protein